MKKSLLTILRDQKTQLHEFRKASVKLSYIIASELALKIRERSIPIQTTLAPTDGFTIAQNVILVPILRSGMALLPAFLYYFDNAKVGFLGLRREETKSKPHLYYQNLPPIDMDDLVLILDPMIATGGSSIIAINKVKEQGAKDSNITLIGLVAAPEGIRNIESHFKEISLFIVAIDKALNNKKFIVPGLGDFGDRYFGT